MSDPTQVFVDATTINLNKPKVRPRAVQCQSVATNVCGDIPPLIPVNIDCSLCKIGFPQAGGQISINFYGPICPPATDPSPSYWLGLESKTAQFKCVNPGGNSEPDPNKWKAVGYFSSVSGPGGCAQQYKWVADLEALNNTQVLVTVTVYVLVPTIGGNTWTTYLTWSETLTETPSIDTTKYRSRAFQSPSFYPISVNEIGGKGDPVSYAKMTLGTFSMRVGCGSTGNTIPDICGMWDGSQWVTCFRGFVKSTNNTNIRDFAQFGFNSLTCQVLDSCGCDKIVLTSLAPVAGNCVYNTNNFAANYGVLGLPGGVEAVGAVQQVQHAPAVSGIDIVVKQVNGGPIYICTNDNGAGWVISVANVAKAKSPLILTATRATFEVWLYALNFPNDNLLPVDCYTPVSGGYPVFESEVPAVAQEEPKTKIPVPVELKRISSRCANLGERIEGSNKSGCGSCHKYKCSVHGECRLVDPTGELKQCLTCEDYKVG